MPLSTMDIVMMRKDPPFDMEYIYTTYLRESGIRGGKSSKPARFVTRLQRKTLRNRLSPMLSAPCCEQAPGRAEKISCRAQKCGL